MSTQDATTPPIFAIATLKAYQSGQKIFSVPDESSSLKTKAPQSLAVVVISRFHTLDQTWFQVVDYAEGGMVILGWVKSDCIGPIKVADRIIRADELPQSHLELNTWKEISALIRVAKSHFKNVGRWVTVAGIWCSGCLGALSVPHHPLTQLLLLGILFLGLFVIYASYTNTSAYRDNEVIKIYIKRLKLYRKKDDSRKALGRLSKEEKSKYVLQLASQNAQQILEKAQAEIVGSKSGIASSSVK